MLMCVPSDVFQWSVPRASEFLSLCNRLKRLLDVIQRIVSVDMILSSFSNRYTDVLSSNKNFFITLNRCELEKIKTRRNHIQTLIYWKRNIFNNSRSWMAKNNGQNTTYRLMGERNAGSECPEVGLVYMYFIRCDCYLVLN